MFKALRLYKLFNLLSLDVVAGAMVCALFFAKIVSVKITPYGLIALGLTVWIIYTTDHLLDAKKIRNQASTDRHQFHQRYFNFLVVILGIIICLDAITIFFVRRQVLERGLILASVVLIYLITHRSLKFLKEIIIAVLYTSGVLLPSVSVTKVPLHTAHYTLIFQFGILALINLLMFSWFDQRVDKQDKQFSFATIVGDRFAKLSIWSLLLTELLLTGIQWFSGGLKIPALLLGIMGLMLLLIFVFREFFSKNDYFRIFGDAIFFIPIFYLI